MRTCASCGEEIDRECAAEAFQPIYDRVGGHRGKCWGGRFPRSADYPPQAADEESEVQRELTQLGLFE